MLRKWNFRRTIITAVTLTENTMKINRQPYNFSFDGGTKTYEKMRPRFHNNQFDYI